MKQEIGPIRNILLIDDDEDDCLFFSLALEAISSTISLSCLQDVDDLLQAIECYKPSLIFLDYHLPKRSGLDCLKQIKSHPHYKHIPVVMWSTTPMQSKEMKASIERVHHFFEKPCSKKDLIEEIRAILLQHG
jgi:response regulator RpfG family c-di-GMP phosphodiesterase